METINCVEHIATGWEHLVVLDDKGDVVKAPTSFGKFWHLMDAGHAEKDQRLLKGSGIRHVPTTVHPGPVILEFMDGTAKKVDYVMRQPYIEDTRTLDFDTIINRPDVLDDFMEMEGKAERLFHDTQMGVDIIGGQGIVDLMTAFYRDRVHARAHNILMPKKDAFDREGNLVAAKNELVLCDTRLYDCTGCVGNLLAHIRRNVQRLQHEALNEFFQHLSSRARKRKAKPETFIHRLMAQWIYAFVKDKILFN